MHFWRRSHYRPAYGTDAPIDLERLTDHAAPMSVSTPEASHEPYPGNIHQAPPPHPLYDGEQQQHLDGSHSDATYEINLGHGAVSLANRGFRGCGGALAHPLSSPTVFRWAWMLTFTPRTTWSSHTRIRESDGSEDTVAQAKKQRRRLAVKKGAKAVFWIIVIVGLLMLLWFVIVPAVQRKIAEAEAEGEAEGSEVNSASAPSEQPEMSSDYIDFGNGTIFEDGELREKPGTVWKVNSTGKYYFLHDTHLWDEIHGQQG